jgi:hypothetical protein
MEKLRMDATFLKSGQQRLTNFGIWDTTVVVTVRKFPVLLWSMREKENSGKETAREGEWP